MSILSKIGLPIALLSCIHAAHGKDRHKEGYDADHKNYFHRVYIPDNSVQLGFSAGYTWYQVALMRLEDFRNGPSLAPAVNHPHVGVIAEKGFFKMRLAIAAGIYYSQLNSYLFGWPNYKGSAYIVDYEDNVVVHYTSVYDVRSVASYVSIPVEVTFPLTNKVDYGIYLKGSAIANINVHTATKFITAFSTPEEVKQRLTSYFESVSPFYIHMHAKLGIRFGSFDNHNVRFEFGIPLSFSQNTKSYYRTNLGITAQVGLYIPLFILL
ncbi:MAG: PorT family protein [Prevotellaceae bacterium]|jgi:hypothetical protein|nr:PorT family protein [Prevotellaceae bacterium]